MVQPRACTPWASRPPTHRNHGLAIRLKSTEVVHEAQPPAPRTLSLFHVAYLIYFFLWCLSRATQHNGMLWTFLEEEKV